MQFMEHHEMRQEPGIGVWWHVLSFLTLSFTDDFWREEGMFCVKNLVFLGVSTDLCRPDMHHAKKSFWDTSNINTLVVSINSSVHASVMCTIFKVAT